MLDRHSEIIAHFIGQFDQAAEQSLFRLHYDAFRAAPRPEDTPGALLDVDVNVTSDLAPDDHIAGRVRWNDEPDAPAREQLPLEMHVPAAGPVLDVPPMLHETTLPEIDVALDLGFDYSVTLHFEYQTPLFELPPPGGMIVVVYHQNVLDDNDVLLTRPLELSPELAATRTDAAFDAALTGLGKIADALTPVDFTLGREATDTAARIETLREGFAAVDPDEAPEGAEVAIVSAGKGTLPASGVLYDGAASDDAPDLLAGELEARGYSETTEDASGDGNGDEDGAEETGGDGGVVHARIQIGPQDSGPHPEAPQIIETGGNLLMNDAAATFAPVDASVIAVAGKSVSLTVVSQVNVMRDRDTVISEDQAVGTGADDAVEFAAPPAAVAPAVSPAPVDVSPAGPAVAMTPAAEITPVAESQPVAPATAPAATVAALSGSADPANGSTAPETTAPDATSQGTTAPTASAQDTTTQGTTAPTTPAQGTTTGSSEGHNIASVHWESAVRGASDGDGGPLAFAITEIYGNLELTTHVTQINLVTDNDVVTFVTTFHTVEIGTGENVSVNALSELGFQTGFDMILVGGDMLNLVSISQMNLLFDDDLVVDRDGVGGEIDTGGNFLWNEAHVKVHGIDKAAEKVSDNAGKALENIGKGKDKGKGKPDEEADADAKGKPDFDALKDEPLLTGKEVPLLLTVGGDLVLDFRLEQINILADADTVQIFADAARANGFEEIDLATGDNLLANVANLEIYGQDSVIMASGGVFSDVVIHQAGMYDTDDTPLDGAVAGSDLASEAVAFLADGMIEPVDDSAIAGGAVIVDTGGGSGTFDTLGGVVA